MDLTARSFFALIEPGSCFAGTLFELALAADRSYMLDDPDRPNAIALSAMNAGPLPMSNGLTRLETRFLGEPERVGGACSAQTGRSTPGGAARPGSSPSRPTSSIGTTRCGWRSRAAPRFRPTR